MSVLVCIPTAGDIVSTTAETAFAICANHPGGASFRTVRAHPTDRCRNMAARMFLDSPHDHMLFLDSDTVPPVNCLEQMLAVKHPIVSGVVPMFVQDTICLSVAKRLGEHEYGFFDDVPTEPFEFDAGGLACCLIARHVLERIEYPWFQFRETEDGRLIGEDISFFEKCAAIGIKPVAVPQVICSHHHTVDLLPLFEKLRAARRAQRAPVAA